MGEGELLDYLMRSTNSALQFLSDASVVEPDPSSKIKGVKLYEAYIKWCRERGVSPMGRNSFYSVVASKYPAIPPEKTKDKTVWFRGLKLKSSSSVEMVLDKYT